jgi:protein gp37
MQNTNIQWTAHTLNFWWGCTKVSRACKHCYAETVAKVFGKRLFGTVPQWGAGKPRFERLEAARKEALKIQRQAVKSGTRPRVFVNSMSDWLDDEVPVEWLAFLLKTLHLCPNVDFQLLTKRPENWYRRVSLVEGEMAESWIDCIDMPERGDIPENLWIGCTVEEQAAADARIPHHAFPQ